MGKGGEGEGGKEEEKEIASSRISVQWR